MKKFSILLIVMFMAGCGGMQMHDSQTGSGASGPSGSGGMSQYDRTPQRVFPQMDPSFEPYFGG